MLHVDPNPYYGASEASLMSNELREWTEDVQSGSRQSYLAASFSGQAAQSSRSYSLSISPSVIVSMGPFITSLTDSSVSRYGGFKLLENVSMYASGGFKRVPAIREEIFKSKDLSLLDKRKLMKFLMFAGSDFENSEDLNNNTDKDFSKFLQDAFAIDQQLALTLTYALAFRESESGLLHV